MPLARSSSSRSVTPRPASYWPGLVTWPEREKNPKPALFSLPKVRNQSLPLRMIEGTEAMDSTLLTQVGLA